MSVQQSGETAVRNQLTTAQFDVIRSLLQRISGIELRAGKEALVQARLARCIQALDLADFDAYLEHVQADRSGRALSDMVDALTTNETSFFREARHFDLLRTRVLPPLIAEARHIRVWSAGCSTGEEAYTLAMVVRQAFGRGTPTNVRILATDLSALALKRARAATYQEKLVARVPEAFRAAAFQRVSQIPPHSYRVADDLRAMVRFARLNLMDPWPMRRQVDVIFCRNVMIYFDEATQQRLIARFTDLLAPGGHLFLGHSEGLSRPAQGLRYVQPAVYIK